MSASGEEHFFQACVEAFEEAAEAGGRVERKVQVGPCTWALSFASPAFEQHMFPAWSHLEAGAESADWRVLFFDSRRSGATMPPPPWRPEQYRAGGQIAGYEKGRFRFFYQPGVDVLRALDTEGHVGIYWVPDLDVLPWWETSFPLRVMIHWAYSGSDWQPVHAGAVGLAGGGVLVAGPSGSGKSTTTLACLESELDYAGDDYVLAYTAAPARVCSLYHTAKIEPDNLVRLPFLRPWLVNAERLGPEKAMVYVGRHRPEKIRRSFPLKAIVLPHVTGERDTRLEPGSAVDAMHAILRTCLIQLPYHGDALMRKVGRLVRETPVYRLHTGTDLRQIPERILELLGTLS